MRAIINSMAPGKYGSYFKSAISEQKFQIKHEHFL